MKEGQNINDTFEPQLTSDRHVYNSCKQWLYIKGCSRSVYIIKVPDMQSQRKIFVNCHCTSEASSLRSHWEPPANFTKNAESRATVSVSRWEIESPMHFRIAVFGRTQGFLYHIS